MSSSIRTEYTWMKPRERKAVKQKGNHPFIGVVGNYYPTP